MYTRKMQASDWYVRIVEIIGSEGVAKSETVRRWGSSQFNKSKSDLNKFFNITESTPLSEEAINSLIIYEYSRKPQPTDNQTTDRINELFGKNTVSFQQVKVNLLFF